MPTSDISAGTKKKEKYGFHWVLMYVSLSNASIFKQFCFIDTTTQIAEVN